MKRLFFLLTVVLCGSAFASSGEAYEHKRVESIRVELETQKPGTKFNQQQILDMMKTKVGDPFSQNTFDQDLKMLSKEFDRVIPHIDTKNDDLYILIRLWQKPVIRTIKWEGNKHITANKLQKELDIKVHTQFNRDEFNRAFNKVKEYYIKKGFFEAHLQYSIQPIRNTNEVDIIVHVEEGRSGHIEKIDFQGFTKKEESELIDMINTKKYNFFTSWLTGRGKYHEEALDHDKMIVLEFLQNRGYADAKVDIEVTHSEETGRIIVIIKAEHGEVFHIGDVTFSGNELYTNEEIDKALLVHKGDVYSPEKIRETIQAIKDLYGKKGYIEATVYYNLSLDRSEPVYNVHYNIEENEQYRIGLIRVLGNTSTNSNVILRESLLVPGEVFDSRKLKATEQRLEAVGYFKSVNVYAVRSSDDQSLGPNYRDVVIEVQETSTGTMSLFFGFSSMNSVFGGLDVTENNFNIAGLWKCWKNGLSSLRGAGEYAHAKISIGKKEQSYVLSWLTPYLRDTRWQFGFDIGYSLSKLESNEYDTKKIYLNLNATHPITRFISWGMTGRISDAFLKFDTPDFKGEDAQKANEGLIVGFGSNFIFNSTNSSYKATRGLRSILSGEIAAIRRHRSANPDASEGQNPLIVPFVKAAWINTYYHPVWAKGTIRLRGNVQYIFPFADGTPNRIPISERYFLGGETTVRGYRTYTLGPKLIKEVRDKDNNITGYRVSNDPQGGISSHLFSIEYLQNILKPIDAFIFFDGGAVSPKRWDIGSFRMSAGGGLRLEVSKNMPLTVGYGYPINPGEHDEKQKFFFAMGAQW